MKNIILLEICILFAFPFGLFGSDWPEITRSNISIDWVNPLTVTEQGPAPVGPGPGNRDRWRNLDM